MNDQGKYRPLSYFQLMEISLRELLVEKGILTNEQVDAEVEDMRQRTPERGRRAEAGPDADHLEMARATSRWVAPLWFCSISQSDAYSLLGPQDVPPHRW